MEISATKGRGNPALLFWEGEALLPEEVVSELERWLGFLDRYASFLAREGESPKGKKRRKRVEPVTDSKRASTLALRARENYGVFLGPAPTLEDLLDREGVLVYRGSFPKGSGVWGAFYRHPFLGFSALVNWEASPGRRALTLAHILAHALHHPHLHMGLCRRGELSPEEKEAERFANTWAAHFLLPGKALKESLKRLGEVSPEAALLLAHRFRVSYPFVLFRLYNEGLIGRKELEEWSQYRLEDLAIRAGVSHGPPAPVPRHLDLERYPPSALRKIRKAVEEGHLSVSGAAALLQVDSTTVERELLAEPRRGENRESEECEEDLRFTSPGRKGSPAMVRSER